MAKETTKTAAKKAAKKKAAKKAPAKKTAAKKAAKKTPAKKAPAKKTAAKKAAKKKVALRPTDPDKLRPLVFKPRIAAGDKKKKSAVLNKMMANVRASVEVLNERSKKRPVRLYTPAELRRTLIPYNELSFQHMLASIGFRTPLAIEVVAPESLGSTTFVIDWISQLADMGMYSVYCECEGKQMDDKRIKRIMDTDPHIAVAKLNAVEWTEARTLAQFDETLRQTVKDLRKRCDKDPETKGNPIWFFGDPWGALMSAAEAKGNSDWGLAANAKPETPKDTTDGSNFGHAKHAQGMARWLPAFMEKYNCVVVFVNKQNDKIEMNKMPGPSFLAPSPLKNDTRVGGRALKRLCAYRMTMLKLGDIREKGGNKTVYGHHVRTMLVKNSYGPRDRTCEFSVYFDCFEDREGYQSPAISFDERTASWMAKHKLLGTTMKDDLFTCDALGCVAVTGAELAQALKNNPEQTDFIGGQLEIEGYSKTPIKDLVPQADPEDDNDEDDELPPVVPGDEASPPVVPPDQNLPPFVPGGDPPPPPPEVVTSGEGTAPVVVPE